MKVLKKEIESISNIEVMMLFDQSVTELTKETNSMRGLTKQTLQSYKLLKQEMLTRLGEKRNYDDGYKVYL